MDTDVIDNTPYQINEKLEEWIKAICIAKDRNKKQEKKEDKLKQNKMNRLLQMTGLEIITTHGHGVSSRF